MCVCVHACVGVHVRTRWGRELGVFEYCSSTVVVLVAWTAVYLTGYSDYLTGFHQPFLPPYTKRCHPGLKMSSMITVYWQTHSARSAV